MPPENEQAVTEEIGDDEIQQWLTSMSDGAEIDLPALSVGRPTPVAQEEVADDPEPDSEPGDGDDEEEEEPPVEPTAEADHFIVKGNKFARADIERLYEFDQYMRSNPDAAQRINTALTGQAPSSQAPVSETTPPASTEFKAPEPPEFLDLDDPQSRFMWDSHVATQKSLFDRDQRDKALFEQQANDRQQSVQRQAAHDMTTALSTFTESHPNLNDDDIAKIRQAAGPFVDGMMKQLPPVEALVRSMEVAAVMDNDLRDKMVDPTVRTRTEKQQTRHRKARLGEISGSARSAPKTESRPAFTSDKDFLNALAQEFSEHMQR